MSASILYTGMDVHKDFVMVAVFKGRAQQPLLIERVPFDAIRLKRFFDRLGKHGVIRACYEASGAGYVLQRWMSAWSLSCDLVAPSLIPNKPGDRRKHDKRDAIQLARLYRAGELTTIHIPTKEEERIRDLVRCRETFQREILKSRHYILKFLRRRGFIYREGEHWTVRHFHWLRQVLRLKDLAAEDRLVFGEYLALLEYKLGRRDELDARVEALALTPAYREAVSRLRCFRGVDTHSAMVLATEIVDWRRFQNPQQLMAYMGLVPTEHSSGERRRQGAITKAGNSHCRHVLVQAAWSYRHPPATGVALKTRQRGQKAAVIAHAWKAQHRCYRLFHRVAARKAPQIAAVAVARELVGFLWAVLQDLDRTNDRQRHVA